MSVLVILVLDLFISNLFCVRQVLMSEGSLLMVCTIVSISVLSVFGMYHKYHVK